LHSHPLSVSRKHKLNKINEIQDMTKRYKTRGSHAPKTKLDEAWEHTVIATGSKTYVANLYRVAPSTIARMRSTLAEIKAAYPDTWEEMIEGKDWMQSLRIAQDIGAPEDETPEEREARVMAQTLEKCLGKRPDPKVLAQVILDYYALVKEQMDILQIKRIHGSRQGWI
jgi:hypothetical protein